MIPRNNKNKTKLSSGAMIPVAAVVILGLIIVAAIVTTGKRDVLAPGAGQGAALVFEGVNVDSVIANNFGLREDRGVLIASEPSGSIARFIGLERGDIVLSVNDLPVSDVGMLMDMLGNMTSGSKIQFNVRRNNSIVTLSYGPSLYSGTKIESMQSYQIIFVILVFFIVFLLIFLGKVDRTIMVSLGAIVMVIFGTYFGFFNQARAFSSINMGTLALLVGMGFFSIFFEETKFSAYTARKIVLLSGGSRTKIILFLCGITYLFSMFVNNLATILVMVPITLTIADDYDMDFVPLLICEVIASNLGGASSMIGDFPNMLISSETRLLFHDFIFFMFPICFLQMMMLFFYMRHKGWVGMNLEKKGMESKKREALSSVEKALSLMKIDKKSVKKGLIILAVVIVGFMFSDIIRIKAPTIALTGGFLLLAVGGVDPKLMLRRVNIKDVIFFAGLFVMVGALDSSGILSVLSGSVKFISGGNLLIQALLVLWVSAFLTSALNAGPATALFIPIIFRLGIAYPHNYIWWALSLGVLAGSCATLTGATAGAVTVTLFEDYKSVSKNKKSGEVLDFRTYAKVGVPIMFLFLLASSFYIVILHIF